MSCRTGSNSVIVSMTQYHAARKKMKEQDETTIKSVFHQLKKEGKEYFEQGATSGPGVLPVDRDDPPGPKDPAPLAEVKEFLREQASNVRNDPEMEDWRREKILGKLDEAVAKAQTGEQLPDNATFYAWQRLEAAARDTIQSQAHDQTMLKLEENQPVDEADVLAAFTYQKRLRQELQAIRGRGRRGYLINGQSSETEETLTARLNQVDEDCRTLVRSYDATPQGQTALRTGRSHIFDQAFPGGRTERTHGQQTPTPAAPTMPLEDAISQLKDARINYQNAHRNGTPKAQEATSKRLQEIETTIGMFVSEHPKAKQFATITDKEATQPSTWDALLAGEDTPEQKKLSGEAFTLAYSKRLRKRIKDGEINKETANSIYAAVIRAKETSVARG